MGRNISGTKQQTMFFELIGDLENPTTEQFCAVFARHKGENPAFYVDDVITIGPNESKYVKDKTVTTIGIYIFNKFLLDKLEIFGYVNKPITSSVWENIEQQIANALLAGDLEPKLVGEYIDKAQYLCGGPLSHLINPSVSSTILDLPPKARKLRDDLFKKYKEELDANDPITSSKVEKEITKTALEEMRETKDPSVGIFDSGAVDPYNNYKTMFVMKGAVKDNTGESLTGYKTIRSNYNDGVTKEDFPLIADTVVRSAYNSGVATQDSGTLGKKYNAVLQRIRVLDHGTDCGSKKTISTVITDRHLYRYIYENNKLTLITPENIDKFKGKVHNIRSPLHCHAEDPTYCSVCVGERPYRADAKNVGLTFNIIAGSTLNASLKTKHDVTIKYSTITVDMLMKYVK